MERRDYLLYNWRTLICQNGENPSRIRGALMQDIF